MDYISVAEKHQHLTVVIVIVGVFLSVVVSPAITIYIYKCYGKLNILSAKYWLKYFLLFQNLIIQFQGFQTIMVNLSCTTSLKSAILVRNPHYFVHYHRKKQNKTKQNWYWRSISFKVYEHIKISSLLPGNLHFADFKNLHLFICVPVFSWYILCPNLTMWLFFFKHIFSLFLHYLFFPQFYQNS